jgi:hypothetical protein
VEFYFGYRHAHSDLTCQDFRSRASFWPYCRYAHEFFTQHVPFWEMSSADERVSAKGAYCLAKEGEVYVVYLPRGGTTKLDLPTGTFSVQWFDPRNGGELIEPASVAISAPGQVQIGPPPRDADKDWAALVQKSR